mgnify:CR=1 FL=1
MDGGSASEYGASEKAAAEREVDDDEEGLVVEGWETGAADEEYRKKVEQAQEEARPPKHSEPGGCYSAHCTVWFKTQWDCKRSSPVRILLFPNTFVGLFLCGLLRRADRWASLPGMQAPTQ